MVLRYPNGQPYYKNASPVEKIQEKRNQITEFGNRGMRFEEAINDFTQASTTDYNGVYRGFYLDFEAKETKNKTSFPFKNFHAHQIEHMKACLEQNGVCFVLLWFSSLKRCFYLNSVHLIAYWDAQKEKGRKSLPLSLIEELGIEIKTGISPRIPYLDAVDFYLSTLSIEGESKNGK